MSVKPHTLVDGWHIPCQPSRPMRKSTVRSVDGTSNVMSWFVDASMLKRSVRQYNIKSRRECQQNFASATHLPRELLSVDRSSREMHKRVVLPNEVGLLKMCFKQWNVHVGLTTSKKSPHSGQYPLNMNTTRSFPLGARDRTAHSFQGAVVPFASSMVHSSPPMFARLIVPSSLG